jgi:hypothetical protein
MERRESERLEVEPPRSAGAEAVGERREHPRRDNADSAASSYDVTVLNISLGGVCVALDRAVQRGERYTLVLADNRVTGTLELRAEVAWTKRGRTGLKWLDVSPEQFLWLCERLGFWWGPGHRFSVLMARPEQVD